MIFIRTHIDPAILRIIKPEPEAEAGPESEPEPDSE